MNHLKIAFIMDPILSIHPKKDTTFALMLEAQKRRWEICYLTPEQIYLDRNEVMGLVTPIQVKDKTKNFVEFLSHHPIPLPLRNFNIVLMRKDPPFDKHFLYSTYLLDIAKKNGCFIVNDPQGIRDANEKLFACWFPQCCPETSVSANIDVLTRFINHHQKVIVKPLGHMGGHGIFCLTVDNPNIFSTIELLTEHGTLPVMAQRYIPEIIDGDKRILMIDGEPYPYVLARIPKQGDIRGNLSAGALAKGQALSLRDKWIANEIAPILKEKGLHFVGLDIIGDYLTEINVTSPTCVREIEMAFNVNICAQIWDKLEAKLLKTPNP